MDIDEINYKADSDDSLDLPPSTEEDIFVPLKHRSTYVFRDFDDDSCDQDEPGVLESLQKEYINNTKLFALNDEDFNEIYSI